MTKFLLVLVLAFTLAGCFSSGSTRSPEAAAVALFNRADSLEAQMAIRSAAEVYGMIADQYPQSSVYPQAVRKAALLTATELNPARNDSLALRWFAAYLALPTKREEREVAQVCYSLLQRMRVLQEEMMKRTGAADSLGGVVRRLGATVSAEQRRIVDLEAELTQVQGELRRLKEIDLKLSKSRGRK
jgi:hypothetical protein